MHIYEFTSSIRNVLFINEFRRCEPLLRIQHTIIYQSDLNIPGTSFCSADYFNLLIKLISTNLFFLRWIIFWEKLYCLGTFNVVLAFDS